MAADPGPSAVKPRPQRLVEAHRPAAPPPRGPFRREFWRSPLRGPWLTSFLGMLLLPSVSVIALTGFISHWAYRPQLPGNATVNPAYDLPALIQLPQSWPSWDYAVTQGVHVTLGLMVIPLVAAKLWSVIPRLFTWPPARNLAGVLERGSMLLLVGSLLVEFVTGTLWVQDYFPLKIDFYPVHYYGAWVFGTMFVLHACIKLPVVRRAYRERGVLAPLRQSLADTTPEPPGTSRLVPVDPAAPTLSRRGLLAMIGGASLTVFVVQAGESIGGPFRRFALLAPRGRVLGTGANAFEVNHTAIAAGVTRAINSPGWRLTVIGSRTLSLSRAQLLQMGQVTETLTISCTEGWSTTQHWTGVRLLDLAGLADVPAGANLHAASLQDGGPNAHASIGYAQWSDPRALLALRVNGEELSADHGYPARVILSGSPGLYNTKWVRELRFEAA
ncbi:MAG TPA: molybdopterin-dependent oxidoreductase [Solirubrobacteraceae bacterium]|jgi:DMSO/TMAO reductase YedYZ molybdopterin-dependent catalytic subunit